MAAYTEQTTEAKGGKVLSWQPEAVIPKPAVPSLGPLALGLRAERASGS